MTALPTPWLLDAHNDSIILREVRGDPMDFADVDPSYHVDLPRLCKGGVGGMFVMVGDRDLAQSVRLVDALTQMEANHPADFAVCRSQTDIRGAVESGHIALVMSIEGQSMFGDNPALLRQWHRLGIRVASLTHGEGRFGGPATALQYDPSHFGYLSEEARTQLRPREKGLTGFAREGLQEMARLGLVLDLTHANDAAFWEALESYAGPLCCTHSNCFALSPHGRNLTDGMMRALADRNGVLALCFFKPFVDPSDATLPRFADHVEHALELMGQDHVGIGTDFDGIPPHMGLVVDDAASVPLLWQELAGRGVSEAVMAKIAHENLLELLPPK